MIAFAVAGIGDPGKISRYPQTGINDAGYNN
jgi:hypothetical protein